MWDGNSQMDGCGIRGEKRSCVDLWKKQKPEDLIEHGFGAALGVEKPFHGMLGYEREAGLHGDRGGCSHSIAR